VSDAGLVVENLDAGYGDIQVLWDVSISVWTDDTIVALVGPNGAGKTTLLKTMSGLIRPTDGRIEIFGTDSTRLSPAQTVRKGFVHVP
jgi:branched-chain amino acid transport system ATP-binding protein